MREPEKVIFIGIGSREGTQEIVSCSGLNADSFGVVAKLAYLGFYMDQYKHCSVLLSNIRGKK